MIKLSIIISFYKSEKYLDYCLTSCLAQNMENDEYEIICVDDGSPDKSADIVIDFQKRYENVKLIRKKNGGVSSARNSGLEEARGKYIWFVDSDDMIRENCLSFLCGAMEKNKLDILMFDIKKIPYDTTLECISEINTSLSDNVSIVEGSNAIYHKLRRSNHTGAYAYLFKREDIQNYHIRFREDMRYSEDLYFIFEYKKYCSRGGMCDNVCYLYRNNPSSATHSIDYSHQIYCVKETLKQALEQKQLYENTGENVSYFERKINNCSLALLYDYSRGGPS